MISVIIPVFNRQDFIQRAIDSVLAQSLKPREIIVVDDGSSDNTARVLESYHDSITYLFQENSGVSAARNRGIKHANGRWIALLDSDDVWHPTKLQEQFDYHDRHPGIFISHTGERWIRNNREIKQKKIHKKPSGWCFNENIDFCKIAPSTIMIDAKVFEKVGYFDEDLEVCEDYDLWLRILREYEIALVDSILTTKYAGHDDQLSFKHHSMDTYRIKALMKHLDVRGVKEEIEKKATILIKGAKKHQNHEIENFYTRLLGSLLA